MKTSGKFWTVVLTGLVVSGLAGNVNAGGSYGASHFSGGNSSGSHTRPTNFASVNKVSMGKTSYNPSSSLGGKLASTTLPVNKFKPINPGIGKAGNKKGGSASGAAGSSSSGSSSCSSSSSSSSTSKSTAITIRFGGGSDACDYGGGGGGYAPVDSPAVANPTPVVLETVRIVNPTDTNVTLAFSVAGKTYSVAAGKVKELNVAPDTVIEFDRGNGAASGRYALIPGNYFFGATPNGWELYRLGDTLGTENPPANPKSASSVSAPASGTVDSVASTAEKGSSNDSSMALLRTELDSNSSVLMPTFYPPR